MKKTVLLISVLTILLSIAIVSFAAPAQTRTKEELLADIDLTAEGTPYVVSLRDPQSYLNIRESAGLTQKCIGKLNDKAEITVLGLVNDWAVIRLENGDVAFVHTAYIVKVKPVETVVKGSVAAPAPTPVIKPNETEYIED